MGVFLSHLYHFNYFGLPEGTHRLIDCWGSTGVSIFFVLSGFVLYLNYPFEHCRARTFYVARFARIYPAYFLALLASVPLELSSPTKTHDLVAFFAVLLLVHQYFPLTDGRYNDVGWTLGVEAFFYALFPPIILAFVRDKAWRAILLCIGALVLGWVIRAGASPDSLYFGHRFPPNRLFEFALGIAGAACGLRQMAATPSPHARSLWLGIFAAATLVLLFVPACFSAPDAVILPSYVVSGIAALALILAIARLEHAHFTFSWLASDTAVVAGEISYAFYLYHNLVLRYLSHGLSRFGHPLLSFPAAEQIALAVLALGITIWLSYESFRRFEQPARKFLRHQLSPSQE